MDFVQTRSLDRSQYRCCHLRRWSYHGLSVYANVYCGRLSQICCFSRRLRSCSPVFGGVWIPTFCTVPLFGTALRLGQFASWIHRHCDRDSISILALEVWPKLKGEKHICCRIRLGEATSSWNYLSFNNLRHQGRSGFNFQTSAGSSITFLCEVYLPLQNGCMSCESKPVIRLDL